MNWHNFLFSIFLALPILGLITLAAFSQIKGARIQIAHMGLSISALRLLMAFFMVRLMYGTSAVFSLNVPLAPEFGIEGLFEADLRRILFIAIAEMVFLFSHYFVDPKDVGSPVKKASSVLAMLLQVLLPMMVLASNLFFFCTVQVLLVIVCFFGVRWVAHVNKDTDCARAADSMLFRYILLTVLFLGWGASQLGFTNLSLSLVKDYRVEAVSWLAWLWVASLFVALPILPWSRWYRVLCNKNSEAAVVFAILMVSSIVFKIVEAGGLVYSVLAGKQVVAIYVLGLLGVLFSISEFFANTQLRNSLTALSGFFFSTIALSIGLSRVGSHPDALLIATFIPGYMVLALFVSSTKLANRYLSVVLAGFLGFMFGIPGSPVYFLYAFIGARSFAGGIELSVLFGLVWALYFFSVVHLSRNIFPAGTPQVNTVSISQNEKLQMAFATFMLLGVSLVCWVFGGGV